MVPGRKDELQTRAETVQKDVGVKLLALFTWSVSIAILSRFCVDWFATALSAFGAVISLFASILLMLPETTHHNEDINLVIVLAYVSLVFNAGAVLFPFYFFIFLVSAILILGSIGVFLAILVWLYGQIVKRLVKQ